MKNARRMWSDCPHLGTHFSENGKLYERRYNSKTDTVICDACNDDPSKDALIKRRR